MKYDINGETKYVPLDVFLKYVKKIAIANKNTVESGKKKGKASQGTWDDYPPDYKGFQDENYGTAISCGHIPELGLDFVAIDLDPVKDRKAKGLRYVELKNLLKVCAPIIKQTYCVITPSGGIHIYILTRTPPKASQPDINMDYQITDATKPDSKGKYIIATHHWKLREDGHAERRDYIKCEKSPDTVAVVQNADEVLQNILQNLEDNNMIKDPQDDALIRLCRKYVVNGARDMFIFALSGAFRKEAGYTLKKALCLTEEIFKGDEEITERLKVVRDTYKKKDLSKLLGISYIESNVMNPEDFDKFSNLIKSNADASLMKLRIDIANKLSKNQAPTSQQLGDYITGSLDLYVDLTTHKRYERLEDGSFEEIDSKRIVEFFNDEFGANKIPVNKCQSLLKHITKTVDKDYNKLEFTNGMLDTVTKDFNPNKMEFDKIPKVKFPFDWNSEGEGGRIREISEQILSDEEHPENMDNFLKAVGHALMGYNSKHIYTILVGDSGTGKTTLITILQRLLTYSEVATASIVQGERFTLYDMIDKDVNIDDDINNGMLKGIGNLNSIISGKNLAVELKGLNEVLHATNQQTPRLFGAGNTLPPVLGQGWWNRLCLIYAPNVFRREDGNNPTGKKDDASLQVKIETGNFDKELEWFVYESVTRFWSIQNDPFPTKTQQKEMEEYYKLQSNPLERAISELYKFTGDENDWILETDVINDLRRWLEKKADNKEILEEHRRHSVTQMRKAMDRAMFERKRKRVGLEDMDTGHKELEMVFVCVEYRMTKQQRFGLEQEYIEEIG